MVHGELGDLAVADQVGPTVADPGDVEFVPLAPQGHDDGGAHVLEVFVGGAEGHDLFVGEDDGPADGRLDRVVAGGTGQFLAQLPGDDLDRPFAGDLAGGLTAHAVGHNGD